MASVFTYDPDPPRVSSPWSTTSGSSTPQMAATGNRMVPRIRSSTNLDRADPDLLSDYGITKLEPEPQEGPTEYKLHLLLRRRRPFVSMSTSHIVSSSYHSRASLPTESPTPSSYDSNFKPQQASSSRSTESRQQRLQHLTTQLLWRLQQSSPFHSSTAANLVLPVLPEATPQLGTPQKPARLLPGLEESQGALYEVGVADDGTFVGLTLDELEESLSTLQVMAASLGCKVDVLRRVIVGNCEWVEDSSAEDDVDVGKLRTGSLWVAEALVGPDWEFYRVEAPKGAVNEGGVEGKGEGALSSASETGQIRVSIAGPSAAGKSSLLGTLTSSVLDNGRGASRLSLLKHRHEISSGITSSVAHELIGYAADGSAAGEKVDVDVINYASGNVAAWDDVHAASEGGRLAFVSDLPGSVRYLKSTLRGLVSWAPHYVFLCIPATCGECPSEAGPSAAEQPADMTLALSHLELCAKMDIPIVVVITKMDMASRSVLRSSLGKVLSALKASGKKPVPLSGSAGDIQYVQSKDADEVRKVVSSTQNWVETVPIVFTSAVDGSGIGKLHALLRYLPIPTRPALRDISLQGAPSASLPENVFDVDEVFAIPPSKVYSVSAEQQQKENHGIVLCGLVRYGAISAGDELLIGPLLSSEHAGNLQHRNRSERRSEQSSSYRSRPTSGDFSTSLQGSLPGKAPLPIQAQWQRVRAVSIRNLRLPVQKLTQDQVGTIGVEPLPTTPDGEHPRLGKIRKGSILVKLPIASPSIPTSLLFHTGFVASFPSSEFASSLSPPVLLGGNAIVYVANVRTTVKLTCMALAEDELISRPPSPAEPEFFSFDGDAPASAREREPGVQDVLRSAGNPVHGEIKVTFALVTSVEWVEVGSRVLLMPGASTALASTQGAGAVASGLEGFVGRICDVLSREAR
ncbi:GTP-binding protein [Aspergillus ellipticus CBS 707.79]|uniref:GTP-binding protein n=1 Tax=Aspergillus ellipticus CBS 707.79 TaxID=1448320 RepID=A0A319DE26_9EURO|nr:GTP-binding protein [Aspergillus ellipticus CBS 707.79]